CVVLEGLDELFANLIICGFGCDDVFRAGQFARLAEGGCAPEGTMLVNNVAYCRAACKARRRVRLTALYADVKFFEAALRALQLRSPLYEFFRLTPGVGDRLDLSRFSDRKALYRLSGLCNAINYPL